MKSNFETSNRLIAATSIKIVRYLYDEIDWKQRLVGILGARYVVQDNIETGYSNTIPLWLFGFLY